MMAQPVVSRTQRRIERKQLVLVVILILAVAGVSFSLGVMFGRQSDVASGGPDGTAGSGMPEIARIEPPPKPAEEVAAEKPEQLTFYDNLPKGKQAPLGSGINLPPEPKAKSSGSVNKAKVVPASPPTKPVAKAGAGSLAASTGDFVVQVASFRTSQDAAKLAGRLKTYDLAVFVETANLGEKGVWYRVLSGPFPSRENADKAVVFLREKERLSAIVRKR
jgi:septal ring-binding cell division protein DamX